MAASNTDKFMLVGSPGTATTLSSPGYTSGVSTSINVGSTTNWPTTTGIVFAIDEATTNSAGEEVRVDGTYNEFIGTVDSATSITNVDYVAGDAERSYSAGATTRVYIPVSATRENRLAEGILVDHSQAGAHEVATNYDPSNPTLETQKWVGVASAVNEITVTNAATGNGPIISATGGDSDIDIKLTPKGTGDVVLPASTSVKTDLVDEVTSAAGVTVDGLLIKDSKLATNDSVVTTNITADAVTDAKLIYGKLRSRQGGSATNWYTAGTTTYDYSDTNVFMQAGSIEFDGTGTDTVTFPTAFNQVPLVFCQVSTAASANTVARVSNITAASFDFQCLVIASGGADAERISWLAIGQ